MSQSPIERLASAIIGITVGACGVAGAATVPFSENFDSYTAGNIMPTGFTESGTLGTTTSGNNSLISVEADSPAGNDYQFNVSAAGSLLSVFELTNVAAPTGFTYSTELTVDSFTTVNANFLNGGLVFLSSSTAAAGYRLTYNLNNNGDFTGKLVLSEFGTTGGFSAVTGTLAGTNVTSTAGIATAAGNVLNLSVSAEYSGTSLVISGTLTDGITTVNVGATDSSPQAGTFFGLRAASNEGNNTANFDFDNLTVAAVPEPATATLLAIVGLASGLRRRRAGM